MQKGNPNRDKLAIGLEIGGAVAAFGVGFLIFRKLRGKRNPDGTSSRVAPSLRDIKINPANLTVSPTDAALYANTLYGAMQNWGTDENTIYDTLNKVNTRDDLLLVLKAFGMKKYLLGGRAEFLGQKMNLIGWLRAELKKKEIAKIKPKFDQFQIPL